MNEIIPSQSGEADQLEWYKTLPPIRIDHLKLEVAIEVEDAMKRESVTKSELAKRLGHSPAWITKVLRGDANPTLETMQKVAEALSHDVHVRIAPKGLVGVWVEVDTSPKPATSSPYWLVSQAITKSSCLNLNLNLAPFTSVSSEYLEPQSLSHDSQA